MSLVAQKNIMAYSSVLHRCKGMIVDFLLAEHLVYGAKMYFCKGMDQVHAFMKIHFDYGYRQRFALVSADAGLY